jgi:hypothetical protein
LLNTVLKLGVLFQREECRLETAGEYIWIQAGGSKRKTEKTGGMKSFIIFYSSANIIMVKNSRE